MKLLLAVFGAALAHDFSKCGTDHLGVTAINLTPDPPVKGKVFTVEIDGTTDREVASGNAHLEVRVFGVKIDSKDFDLCTDFGVTCPVAAGASFKGKVSYKVPSAAPGGVTAEAKITVSSGSTQLSCVNLKVKIHSMIDDRLSAPATSADIVSTVNSANAGWVAHESPRFYNKTMEDVKTLCGTVLKSDENYFGLPEKEGSNYENIMENIPTSFDARDQWPSCPSIGHIRDQSSCGSCWAFGSTEAYNDRRCIRTGDKTLLSPEDTVACCGFFQCFSQGCNGGQPAAAWRWFTRTGVVTGGDFGDTQTCLPYSLKPCAHHVTSSKYAPCPKQEYSTPQCSKQCSVSSYSKSYSSDKLKAKSSYSLSGVAKIQSDIMKYGPVTGAFTVYADFPSYKSGVYKHTSGSQLGGHAIKILGWGVENGEDYWLVANSWNEQWGDNGFFKISRGNNECGIESQISAGQA